MRVVRFVCAIVILAILGLSDPDAQEQQAANTSPREYHYSRDKTQPQSNYLTIHTDYELIQQDASCEVILGRYRKTTRSADRLAARLCTAPGIAHGYVGRYRLHLEYAPLFDVDQIVHALMEEVRDQISISHSGGEVNLVETDLRSAKKPPAP